MTQRQQRLEWSPGDGGPLGRHINHDERSKNYRVARVEQLTTAIHKRRVPVYDQGDLGSCVAHAGKGVLSTAPFTHRYSSESNIIKCYRALTEMDPYPGSYPPDDTGTDGLTFAKWAVQNRQCTSYVHAFGIEDHIHGLQKTAGMVGTAWLDGMDRPDPDGRVHPVGSERGGHEYECFGYEMCGTTRNDQEDRLWFWQSWGQWALGGKFWITVSDFAGLLAKQGDSTFLVK